MVELLAPARDFASLSAAIKNGADAVYVGLEGHNMRAHSRGFNQVELKEAVRISHDEGVKLYLCTNTIMKDRDIDLLRSKLPGISSMGVDALIASDLGVIPLARDNNINVHLSVQANVSNLEALRVLQELGVKRIILSRELSLTEITEIAGNTSMELEVFIHGAMCLAISGRCFLSSYLYQKSANCGECIQPCRREWTLVSGHDYLKVEEGHDESPGHILSPKDLCMVEHIPELVESGVKSFKIEGRARSPDYVAAVTRVYRDALDSYTNGQWNFQEAWVDELSQVYNRGFDTGFYFRKPHQISDYNQAIQRKKDIGKVINYYSEVGAAEIQLWDDLELQDEIIIQGPTTGSINQKVESIEIHGKKIYKAENGQNIGIKVENRVRANDLVYKTEKNR